MNLPPNSSSHEKINLNRAVEEESDCEALASCYLLLARLWANEVSNQLLSDLLTEPLATAWVEAGGCLPELPNDSQTIEQLAVEYCQLFIGPKNHLPLYQSVWQQGQFQGEAAQQMGRYLELLPVGSTWRSSLPPDHLAVQLATLGEMHATLAFPGVTDEERESLEQLIRSFHQQHLGWAVRPLQGVITRDDSPFYSGVAKVTLELLAE